MAEELTYDGTLREMPTDSGVLRYHEAGEGAPLLLLHGSGPGVTGWRNFRGILGTLAPHFPSLIPEFPAFAATAHFGGHPLVPPHGPSLPLAHAIGPPPAHTTATPYAPPPPTHSPLP